IKSSAYYATNLPVIAPLVRATSNPEGRCVRGSTTKCASATLHEDPDGAGQIFRGVLREDGTLEQLTVAAVAHRTEAAAMTRCLANMRCLLPGRSAGQRRVESVCYAPVTWRRCVGDRRAGYCI